ncbi:Na(+)-translocating NADH-quinone reductase subunit A [Saccharicrinis sp. FJH54]|uniref:Na(+)-translocating NADH-quinone reductase subunit A n=1 Tax=Saccharicrinis sp. FJH54 TaxID=3344665 RepID=UPI0035D4123C
MIKIRKGLDIKLEGKAEEQILSTPKAELFALKPTDFHGLTPKLLLKPGEKVKVGTPVFFDKYNPKVLFVSPVSGELVDVVRGERRRILEVVIKSDGKMTAEDLGKSDVSKMKREEVVEKIQQAGMWSFIKQRPYDIIAKANKEPKAIFISGFDTAPLAPDYSFMLKDKGAELQEGINVLKKLTAGKVHLSVDGNSPAKVFKSLKGVEIHEVDGPHPAGNVGIQIHHIDAINKNEVAWVINPQDVAALGSLFINGKYDPTRTIAITGSELKKTGYYNIILGMSVTPFIADNVNKDVHLRVISGNVLTGTKISKDGYLGAYHHQLTVIPEGDDFEFMGWANPGFNKFSVHGNVFSKFLGKRTWKLDANLHGGYRALVMSGEYEKVLPMDILPEFLLKSVIVKDIDKMEQLGIYEIAPEDMALCEVVCTSKTEVQRIIREGLDLMIQELG